MLARTRPIGLSALNILPCEVTAQVQDDGPGALVQLRGGDDLILARVTLRSAIAMDLAPGAPCHAIVKSVSLVQDG